MGTVFLARDTKLGRLVAIKLLLEYSGPNAARFLAEARATARSRHDNIVVIHEVDEIDGYPYMVLEFIKGRTLRDWMAQAPRPSGSDRPSTGPGGPASASQAVEFMLPVARALTCAHELGIVHRDLRSSAPGWKRSCPVERRSPSVRTRARSPACPRSRRPTPRASSVATTTSPR